MVWKHLNHPNIVPFKGVTFDPLQLVSEWMPGGELREYVGNNWDTNLIILVRRLLPNFDAVSQPPPSQSLGIAEGLNYLHSSGVIHGDLKGVWIITDSVYPDSRRSQSNIVIDDFGNPRITDFGLATIVRDPNSYVSTSEDQGHTLRWTAPEIFGGEAATRESDVFSFGMVIIEVSEDRSTTSQRPYLLVKIFTGEIPFKRVPTSEVVVRVTSGDRPKRPTHPKFTDPLWELTQSCWRATAQDRPKMEDVLEELLASGFSFQRRASHSHLLLQK